MTVVAFPFKSEEASVVAANLLTATHNRAVDEVWAVAAQEGDAMARVAAVASEISAAEAKPVLVFSQERIGSYRAGKGDGMNTAIGRAAEAGVDRLHFYDADITNFGASWIDGAERAADRGFGVVRHRFPRPATDAMITWMVTRPGLAMLFRGSLLPRLGQPLGGEILLTSPAIEAIASDPSVRARSDWGIDTILTHAMTTQGLDMYEHLVPDGKRHALYGSLDELRTMMTECLDAVASLGGKQGPSPDSRFHSDPAAPVPNDLKSIDAYDVSATVGLLGESWSQAEVDLAKSLPGQVAPQILENLSGPNFEFMDEEMWGLTLGHLLANFRLGDATWESLAFRLWVTRVLAYTTSAADLGYDAAMEYLESTIRQYQTVGDHHVQP